MAAVAAFLTARHIARQRKDAYRPDLTFSHTRVYAYACGDDGKITIPETWYNKEKKEENSLPKFKIEVYNVGFGAAKDITILWESSIEEWVDDVNARAQRVLLPAFYSYDKGILSFQSNGINWACMWENKKSNNLSYILPSYIDKEGVSINFPLTLSIYCQHIFSFFQSKI